jgi:hypothetical protein
MGHRRDNAGLRAGDTTVCSLTLALHHEPICPEDKEKLNRGTREQIDWSRGVSAEWDALEGRIHVCRKYLSMIVVCGDFGQASRG